MGEDYLSEMQLDLIRFAVVNLLVTAPFFYRPKKHVLNPTLICAALGRLCWSFRSDLAVSVLFNVCTVSRSSTELSTPIGAFMGLCSHTNLPCLVNMALNVVNIVSTIVL